MEPVEKSHNYRALPRGGALGARAPPSEIQRGPARGPTKKIRKKEKKRKKRKRKERKRRKGNGGGGRRKKGGKKAKKGPQQKSAHMGPLRGDFGPDEIKGGPHHTG